MEAHVIGALVSTLAILIFVFTVSLRHAGEIDKERHLKNNRSK